MSVPVLVTPPEDAAVQLDDLKLFLRVDHDDEDALISALADAATGWLDGWDGILGRAIMPQTWRETFIGPGPHWLSLPNVQEVAAEAEGEVVDLTTDLVGAVTTVQAEGVEGELQVTYSCGLPPARLAVAQAAIKMLVAHWYNQREAVVTPSLSEVPLAVAALIASLRWRLL